MDRRTFLKAAGLTTLSMVSSLNPFGLWAWSQESGNGKKLVVVFLRGAVDGLSVLIPSADSRYYDLRPNIAIPEPGRPGGALPLNQRFGLHPALESLYPMWRSKALTFYPCTGLPTASRSHFDAQEYMESGTPGKKSTIDGWMNRLLKVLPGGHTPTQAVNFGPTIPRILSGKETVANISAGRQMTRRLPTDSPVVQAGFDSLYTGSDPISQAYREAQAARKTILSHAQQDDREQAMANNGASLPNQFVTTAQSAARLIRQDRGLKVCFMAVGAWDTHINQGGTNGPLARNLKQLGEGLAALYQGLGAERDNTTIVVMSEFGRTVKENGNGGTDHGHGNVMWVLGGNSPGGRIVGEWPGLSQSALFEGRDLPVLKDYRAVLTGVMLSQLDLSPHQVQTVFPGFMG
jgi:uncharacterized protein (DUF1501 family)